MDQERILEGERITILCAHGDVVSYPIAEVQISVGGRCITVEAAVSDTLPRAVLLGTDVHELGDLLEQQKVARSYAVLTRKQAQQRLQEKEELRRKEEESGARPAPMGEEEESLIGEEHYDESLIG